MWLLFKRLKANLGAASATGVRTGDAGGAFIAALLRQTSLNPDLISRCGLSSRQIWIDVYFTPGNLVTRFED